MPLAVIGLPVAIYIPPFYSGTLGLDLAAVGLILMVARLSDVVTDPLIGGLSDRTRTRWGRRRPWVALGVPVMMVSAFMLFVPRGEVTNLYLLIWISAIYFGFTLISIPYGAWGAELSGDYGERNRISGAREIFLLLGLLIAITAPIVGARLFDHDGNSAGRGAMAVLGWIPLLMLPVCAVIAFSSVPEPGAVEIRKTPIRKGLRIAMRNGPFRLILSTPILGASILADVVDLDTIKSGEQRTAFIFAFLGMVRKVFEAAGVGIALPVLAWAGFDPKVMTNSPQALFMLTAMYCLVPLVL